jgi:hypothetical protein
MKPIPPSMSFARALRSGYVGRMEKRAYLDWVKTLACVACESPADDPHHIHGRSFKGMGTKVPDWWVLPLCRPCHDELHRDFGAWEQAHGEQFMWVCLTLLQAIHEDRIRWTGAG